MNRRYIKSKSGRAGEATRGGTPASHVNTKRNKRAANKAARKEKADEQVHTLLL
jgi:hypothetical protein